MRFDDVLGTVRTIDLTTPAAAQAAWRQIVDLVGRGRAAADAWALSTLETIRAQVPVAARAASARALFGARPPAALVRVLATDDIAVGAPVLRAAQLDDAEWVALLPQLSPAARAVLRHRRDLSAATIRALESFGSVDFVLSGTVAPELAPEDGIAPAAEIGEAGDAVVPAIGESGPFQSLGAIAKSLPVVAEALRRENDNEAPVADGDVFRIADVVARIEAFQQRQADALRTAPARADTAREAFRFETDATGALRWAEGMPREAILGTTLARPADPARAGVDGTAAGAFRRRARFDDAHLVIAGTGPAAGRWLMSAIPVFDAASGRFTGYRGSARRPLHHEAPLRPAAAAPSADSLRQLVHELRTPTNAIAGFSEMIECEMLGPVADVYRGQAATMRDDAHRLLSAIDDVDVAARVAGGALPLSPQPVEVAPLVARLAGDLHLLAESRGAVVEIEAGSLVALADPAALERGVSRLLGAVIGAAAMGETVVVSAAQTSAGRIAVSVSRPRAFAAHPGDAILSIDDEESPASLLGVGFSLRLVRNLARAIGGAFDLGDRDLTLHLPAVVDDDAMGHTASS